MADDFLAGVAEHQLGALVPGQNASVERFADDGIGRRFDKGEQIALNVKVGDRVLFGKYSGQTVKVDGDELLVMKEDDLFAVVEK